jgi:hypothetical protein
MLAAAVLALPACEDNTLAPFEPQISNAADNFQFQVTGLTGVTLTREYPWQNSGARADVNQATQLTGGTATLQVLDAAGTQVYSRSLTDNGTFETSAGTAGSWKVRVVLSAARGTVNFRVQKHP